MIELTGARSRRSCTSRCRRTTRASASPISSAPAKQLGWAPRTQLDEGLRKTIAYFEKLLTDEGLRAMRTRGNG